MTSNQSMRRVLGYFLLVVFAVVLSAAGAFTITSMSKKVYTAEAQLVVTSGLGMTTTGSGDVLTAPRLAQTYATLALTRPVLLEVISRAQLPYDPTELARHLRLTAEPASPFIVIAATDENPGRAAKAASAVAEVLVEQATALSPGGPVEPKLLAIVERAIVPQEPSGPRVLLSTVLAAGVAFILALTIVALFAYLREGPPARREGSG